MLSSKYSLQSLLRLLKREPIVIALAAAFFAAGPAQKGWAQAASAVHTWFRHSYPGEWRSPQRKTGERSEWDRDFS